MHEKTNGYEMLMAEMSQRSEEIDTDYLYNDIGPLLYVYAAPAGVGLPEAELLDCCEA